MRASETNEVAKGMASLIAWKLPAETSTLFLAPPANGREDNALTQTLTMELRKVGFAIASNSTEIPDTHIVQYLISPLDYSKQKGILVRVRINQMEASRWYLHHAGSLIAASPLTVKEDLP